MPALHYRLRWPDASETVCYSPSLVIQDYLREGEEYALDDLLRRLRDATAIANDRVREKFGFACSRASDQLERNEALAAGFSNHTDARVRVLSFEPA